MWGAFANYMPNEDEQRRLLEDSGMPPEPPPAPAEPPPRMDASEFMDPEPVPEAPQPEPAEDVPSAEPVADPAQFKPSEPREPDALDLYTMPQYSGNPLMQLSQRTPPTVPTPPQLSAPNGWALGGAALLDLALNRGRHAGELLGAMAQGSSAIDQQNYKNQLENARTQAQIDHLYANQDPYGQALKIKNLELAERRLKLGEGRETRLEEILANKKDPKARARARAYLIGEGIPETEIPLDMPPEEFDKMLPAWRERIRTEGPGVARAANAAGAKAKATAEATEASKVRVAGKSAAAGAAARLPYQEALQDYGIGTAAEKSKNTQDARIKANAGATSQGDQEAEDVVALHPWLGFAGEAGKRQYLREGANRFTQRPRNEDIQLADQMINASAEMHMLLNEYREALTSADPREMARVSAKYNQYRNEHAGIIRRISRESNAAGVGEHIREDLPSKLGLLAPDEMQGIAEFLHEQSNARMALHGMFVRDFDPEQISAHFKTLRAQNPPKPASAPRASAPQVQAGGPGAATPSVDDFF